MAGRGPEVKAKLASTRSTPRTEGAFPRPPLFGAWNCRLSVKPDETRQKPPRRRRSGICVEEDGFSVIVGERVLFDRLVDPIPSGRVGPALAVWFHANALLPQSETFEHLLDHVPFVNEGHDPHFPLAVGADEGIGFPYFLDEVPPFLGRDAAGLVFGHVDDLPRRASLHALFHLPGPVLLLGAFLSLATHIIGIPTVVAHELKLLSGMC